MYVIDTYYVWRKKKVLVAQLYLTLCNPMECSPPGSSVHGILQAKILEWVAISFSRGSGEKWFTIYLLWIKSPKCFQKQHDFFFSLRALCRLSNSDSPANHFSSHILKWKAGSGTKLTGRKGLPVIRTSDMAFEVICLNASHALYHYCFLKDKLGNSRERCFLPISFPKRDFKCW